MKKSNYEILTYIPEDAPTFSSYILKPYFTLVGELIPNQEKEKLEFYGDEEKYSNTEGAVYLFVIDDKILKIGKTDSTMKKRIQSYNCGKRQYKENGTCSTTNYKVLQSFLTIGKRVELYCYFVPPIQLDVFGETVSITTSPSKYIEKAFQKKTQEQFGDKLSLCIQNQEVKMIYTEQEVFKYFNNLNKDTSHYNSSNDICTPMECVKEMINEVPQEFWRRENIKVLDCCAGNGNFPAYISLKTSPSNIYCNEINPIRLQNLWGYFGETVNIIKQDFLTFPENEKYDMIVANPPYAKFTEDGKRAAKNHNLSRDFLIKALSLVADNGYLVFILPNNWMSFADRNKIPSLLSQYQFITINIEECKKWFPKVGSSFSWFVLKKVPNNFPAKIINGYKIKDTQYVVIPQKTNYIPLYYNETVSSIFQKTIDVKNKKFEVETSSDLHKYTKKKYISVEHDNSHPYKLIHTPRQVVWSSKPHKYQEGWKVFISTTTNYETFIDECGMTQSIAFIRCNSKEEAELFNKELQNPLYYFLVALTRYGNFNNERILQRLPRFSEVNLTQEEQDFIEKFNSVYYCGKNV